MSPDPPQAEVALRDRIEQLESQNASLTEELTRQRLEADRFKADAQHYRASAHGFEQELFRLQTGVGWALLVRYRNFLARGLPTGSRRERLYRRLKRALQHAPAGSPPPLRLRERIRFYARHAQTYWRVADMVLREQGLAQMCRVVGRGVSWRLDAAPCSPAISANHAAYKLRRRVTIAIPTYNQTTLVADCVDSILASLHPQNRPDVRIVLVDDASSPDVQAWLRKIPVEVVSKPRNEGYARAVNDVIARLGPDEDLIVLNNDTIAHDRWIEALQACAYSNPQIGIVGAKLLYPDGRIQFAGTYRSVATSQWFDHCYRFTHSDNPPANVQREVLAITGACMYIKRVLIDAIGPFDPAFPMAFEDVDYCLRARAAGFQALYCPQATLTHLEGHTRGERKEAREFVSQDYFWEKWGAHFDGRRVWKDAAERLSIIYVLQDTGVAGGHRVAFEHMNRLAALGHDVELYSLAHKPTWFPLEVPVRTFGDYESLLDDLSRREAFKVATWWETSEHVWKASLTKGIPVYLVQDIETSYYGGNFPEVEAQVLASYRKEFHYLTDATWTQQQLRVLGVEACVVSPGIDDTIFRALEGKRASDVVLSIGRSHPLKNFNLLRGAVGRVRCPASLWLFGIEPTLGKEVAVRYVYSPTDAEIARLYNHASVFVLTSIHEGYGLPILEAMACGCPVICTDADGNMDFCRDGENCMIVPRDREDVLAATLERLLRDKELQDRLRRAGLATARSFTWDKAISSLNAFYRSVAHERSRRLGVAMAAPNSG